MANNIIRRTWKQGGMVNIEDLRGSAFQAEDGGHTFLISGVYENGDALALSGTPAGVLLRADGQDVTLTCSVSEGVVSATLPANAYVVPGRIGITIFLTNGGQKTAIYAAIAAVATTSSGTVAPPAGADVVTLVNAIATAVATIPASYTDLMAAVAPTYSTSALYAVGSYAWYSGKLYRCTTAITSGETWTSAHWTQANLGSDVSDLKSAFPRFEHPADNIVAELVYSQGGYYNGDTFVTNENFGYTDLIPCKPNTTYYINTDASQYFSFYDENKAYITGSGAGATSKKSPATAAYIRLSVHKNRQPAVRLTEGTTYKNRLHNKADRVEYYITNGGSGVSWKASNGQYVLTLDSNDHKLYVNENLYTITKSQILTAAQSAGLTVSGDTITASSYCIYYDPLNNSVGAVSSAQNASIISNNIVLFAAHYTSFVNGLIVDFIEHKQTTAQQGFDVKGITNTVAVETELLSYHLDSSRFLIGSLSSGVYKDSSFYPYRIATPDIMYFPFDVYLNVKKGYRYAFHTFINGVFSADSGWQYMVRKIPANTQFKITISKNPEGTSTPDINTYCKALFISDKRENVMVFTLEGNHIPFIKQRYGFENTGIKAKYPSAIEVGTVTNQQGFGYYGGVIFQMYSDNVTELIDYETKTVIADLVTETGHGNCMAFLDDFYSNADEFPMAIISDTLSNPKAYVTRIERTGFTKIKTLSFPAENAGHYANAMIDNLNKVIYTVGYSQNSWSDPSNNKTVFAKWDYTQQTENLDGSYTPEFIEKFTVPFIVSMQASAFFNGKLFVASSLWSSPNSMIYVIDPVAKQITNIIKELPDSIKESELEGIFFINEGDSFCAMLKTNDGNSAYIKMFSNV